MPTNGELYAASRLAIKLAVAAKIKTLLPTSLVLPLVLFKPEDVNWPNMLKSPDDGMKINAVQVGFLRSGRESNEDTPPGTFVPQLSFAVGFYAQYDTANASISEDLVDSNVSIVQYGLEEERNFGLTTIDTHEGLVDVRYNLTPPLGQSGRIYYGVGRLDILMRPLNWRS